MILAVSHEGDAHAPLVLGLLRQAGHEVALLDLADFPASGTVSVELDPCRSRADLEVCDGESVPLENVSAVWWRRPRTPCPPPGLTPCDADYARAQTTEALMGLFGSLGVRWVNEPWADQRASHKVSQLRLARSVGLLLPDTLVSNEPDRVRAFLDERGGQPTIHKPLHMDERTWRPTRFVTLADRARIPTVRLAPAIFQTYIAGVDVRVTAVGGELFAAAIDARGTASPEDCRYALNDPACRVSACRVPDDVADRLRAFLARMGLAYAAADFRIRADGAWVFLEVNPSGQWYWVEERTGQPITAALVDLLARA